MGKHETLNKTRLLQYISWLVLVKAANWTGQEPVASLIAGRGICTETSKSPQTRWQTSHYQMSCLTIKKQQVTSSSRTNIVNHHTWTRPVKPKLILIIHQWHNYVCNREFKIKMNIQALMTTVSFKETDTCKTSIFFQHLGAVSTKLMLRLFQRKWD